MPRPEPATARSEIVEIIGNSVYHALGLKETLEEEREALRAQDMDKLQAALDMKASCVAELQGMEQKRQVLCEAAGFAAGAEQMAEMMAWCDESAVIENCWLHLMQIAAECLSINDTNGAIIHGRKQQIESTLTVVRGGTINRETYDFRGKESRDQKARPIAQA